MMTTTTTETVKREEEEKPATGQRTRGSPLGHRQKAREKAKAKVKTKALATETADVLDSAVKEEGRTWLRVEISWSQHAVDPWPIRMH